MLMIRELVWVSWANPVLVLISSIIVKDNLQKYTAVVLCFII